MGHYFIVIAILLGLHLTKAEIPVKDTITVDVPGLGKIQGSLNVSLWSQRIIYQFKGIPYAQPPSGLLRFKEPVPAKPWKGTLDATEFQRRCPQAILDYELALLKKTQDLEDVEDCLHLNVFTTQLPGECGNKFPVMFFIHGGSFRVGSASEYESNYLLEQDVVLVTIQYRLGLFGFLSLQDDSIAGNMGLLDQVLALKWVRDNIAKFCGDPSEVTIFGQSAGGAAVSLMLVSPLAQDLFSRAIVQSGSFWCHWAIDAQPEKHAREVAEMVKCNRTSKDDILKCLQNVKVSDLIDTHNNFISRPIVRYGKALGDDGGNHYVIQEAGKTRFITEDPALTYWTGLKRYKPIMVGITKDEASFFLDNVYDHILQGNASGKDKFIRNELISRIVRYSGMEDRTGAISDVFQDWFLPDEKAFNFSAMVPGLIDLCGVVLLKSCTLKLAKVHYKLANTYLYSFNYYGHLTKFGYGEEVDSFFPGGVAHSDDLIYLFPFHKGNLTEPEKEIAKTMVELWTNFAIYGKPTPAQGVYNWPAMTGPSGPYLRIEKHPKVRDNFIDELRVTRVEGLDGYSSPASEKENNSSQGKDTSNKLYTHASIRLLISSMIVVLLNAMDLYV